jgi:hypothetical protein
VLRDLVRNERVDSQEMAESEVGKRLEEAAIAASDVEDAIIGAEVERSEAVRGKVDRVSR